MGLRRVLFLLVISLSVFRTGLANASSLLDVAQLVMPFSQTVESQPGTNPAIAAASQTLTAGQFLNSASASGSATYGTLTGLASATAVAPASCSGAGPGSCGSVEAQSTGSFDDVLTVVGSSRGLSSISATGTLSGSGTGQLQLVLDNLSNATGGRCVVDSTGSCTTALAQLVPGANTVTLQGQLNVVATAMLASGGSLTVTSDFSHTGILDTIHGFDANGNELSDFSVTAESGFDYPTGPLGTTPEPTTLLLWGTSMAGLGLAARWRRRRQN